MDALELIDSFLGDNIPTDEKSAKAGSQNFCQEGTNCDCHGCSDSG